HGRYPEADIRNEVYFGDINWTEVIQMASMTDKVENISKFPIVERDLALIVSTGTKFEDIRREIGKVGGRLIRDVSLFDVYEDENHLGTGKQSYGVKILFSDPDKTLKDKEVDQKVSIILDNLQKKWGIYLR